jgi:hypothetical protein
MPLPASGPGGIGPPCLNSRCGWLPGLAGSSVMSHANEHGLPSGPPLWREEWSWGRLQSHGRSSGPCGAPEGGGNRASKRISLVIAVLAPCPRFCERAGRSGATDLRRVFRGCGGRSLAHGRAIGASSNGGMPALAQTFCISAASASSFRVSPICRRRNTPCRQTSRAGPVRPWASSTEA